MSEDEEESNAPILFLSARTKDSDKTLGFSVAGMIIWRSLFLIMS